MRKVLILGLVLLLGLAIFVGCGPKKTEGGKKAPATPTKPAPKTGETESPVTPKETGETGAPGETGKKTPEAKDEIGYLLGVRVAYSLEEAPKKEGLVEEETMVFPVDAKSVALMIDESPEAPEGKEIDVSLYGADMENPLVTNTFKTDEVTTGAFMLPLTEEGKPLEKGFYTVKLVEKDSGKEKVITFNIGEPKPPEDMKETPKEGEGKMTPEKGETPSEETPMKETPKEKEKMEETPTG